MNAKKKALDLIKRYQKNGFEPNYVEAIDIALAERDKEWEERIECLLISLQEEASTKWSSEEERRIYGKVLDEVEERMRKTR